MWQNAPASLHLFTFTPRPRHAPDHRGTARPRAARSAHAPYSIHTPPRPAECAGTDARQTRDRPQREREREDTTRTRPRRNSYIVVVVYYFCGVPPALLLGEVSAARSPEFLSLNAGSPLQRMIKPDRINPMPKEYPVSRSSPWPSPSPITTRPADCGECTR